MNLAFRTKINNQPTHFVEKIWEGLFTCGVDFKINDCIDLAFKAIGKEYRVGSHIPKIHTIRKDDKQRWKAGNKIHFIINNRTKQRFQFAPVIPVQSTQRIIICWALDEWIDFKDGFVSVVIDSDLIGKCEMSNGKVVECSPNIEYLAKADGFNTVEDFFRWFHKDFNGKIIHWTDHKY